jgi:15-cis-phytoene synthase
MPVAGAVADSYRNCKRIASESRSNFCWAFSLLRPEKQRGMYALYAYARLVDDWADSSNDSKMSESKWHTFVERCAQDTSSSVSAAAQDLGSQVELIAFALSDMIKRFKVPVQYLHEIIEGVAFDLQPEVFIQDEVELDRYCYLVASSVGLVCLSIWGCHETAPQEAAIACGQAFQITNILRDVREDAQRGRVYIPRTLFEKYGISVDDWKASRPSGNWKTMVDELGSRASHWYRQGFCVMPSLDIDSQRMFSLMWKTYSKLLDRIRKDPDEIWRRRIRLSRLEKTQLFIQHAISPCFSKAPQSVEKQ